MKKIIAFILLVCMLMTLAACTGKAPENTPSDDSSVEDSTPKITLQEVYNAGKSLSALLGDHENVYVKVVSDGKVIREEYLNKQFYYSYNSAEYMDMGFEYADFTTDHSQYVFSFDVYALNVTLTPSGMIDTKNIFAERANNAFISSEVVNDDKATITEKDGFIIVTSIADVDEILTMGDDIASCTETYTLDAKTCEMIAVKTVYTYKDGTVKEGIVTVTRDVELPEGAKPFVAYDEEAENLRTVTIVSNPGAEDEKTESIKAPKGLAVVFSPDWDVEQTLTVYTDAACTQVLEEESDLNSDVTVYAKWTANEI